MLKGEEAARATDPALHLIKYQQEIIPAAQLAQTDQELLRGGMDPSLSLNGLHEDRAGVAVDQFREARQIVEFAKSKAGDQLAKPLLDLFLRRRAHATKRAPVKGLFRAQDAVAAALLAPGLLHPMKSRQLDQGFVGLRSTVAKKHPARSGLADQSARKLSLVWIAKQIAGVDQLTGLALHRRDPVRMTMTQRADGDARGEVEKLPPQIIPDPGALSANQRERGSRIVLHNVRVVEFGGAGANNGRTAHENIG